MSVPKQPPEADGDVPSPPNKSPFTCPTYNNHPIRRLALRIVASRWLERISLLSIIVNCIALGMVDPCDVACKQRLCISLGYVEHVILTVFTVEMIIKMAALGFCGYLSDVWNCLDAFIIMASVSEYAFVNHDINLSAIRAIRVLRPLRAIHRISSLRLLVTLLLDTMPMLSNVLMFCFFVFFLFGIVAVQLWSGVLRNRCFFPTSIINSSLLKPPPFMPAYYNPPNADFVCSVGFGELQCSRVVEFEKKFLTCNKLFGDNVTMVDACRSWLPSYSECRPHGPNPHRGTVSFDNIGFAWIAIFQVISLQGWAEVMYLVQDAYSFWSWIYFFVLIWVGSYVAVNLCLVVIAMQFSRTKNLALENMRLEKSVSSRSSSGEQNLYQQIIGLMSSALRSLTFRIGCIRAIRDKFSPQTVVARRSVATCPGCRRRSVFIPDPSADSQKCTRCGFDFQTCAVVVVKHKASRHEDTQRDTWKEKLELILWRNRLGFRVLLENTLFQAISLTIIAANAFVMSLEHYGQPVQMTIFLEQANLIFTFIFSAELLIKFYAYGPLSYVTATFFNLLDTVVIVVNVLELFNTGSASGVSVLRLFRLFRLVKIIRYLPQLQKQLVVMLKTVDEVTSFVLLLSFFVYVAALLGMSLFGCRFRPESEHEVIINENEPPRFAMSKAPEANFDSLLQASFSVLQVLTQDNWASVLRDGMHYTSDWAGLYFVCVVAIGDYILFNLLIAILVEAFSSQNEEKAEVLSFKSNSQISADNECHLENRRKLTKTRSQQVSNYIQLRWMAFTKFFTTSTKSCYLFAKTSFPRKQLRTLLASKYYDKVFMIVIISSCLPILLERPAIQPDSLERQIIRITSYVFNAVFTVEAICKTIAFGFIIGRSSYLRRNWWNVIDFFLVCLSLVDDLLELLPESDSPMQQAFRILYLLRCFRPLRLISRAQGLQIVLTTLAYSVKPVGNTILICCLFYGVFAILGVQLFSGCFAKCKPPLTIYNGSIEIPVNITFVKWSEKLIDKNVTTRSDCLSLGFEWTNERYNFDNVPNALMALFVFSTLDGWAAITRNGLSCVGKEMQPIRNYNNLSFVYFISFLLIVCFFILNMFVGVVVNNFRKVQMQFMTRNKRLQRRKSKTRNASTEKSPQHNCRSNSASCANDLNESPAKSSNTKEDQEGEFWLRYPPWRRAVFFVCTHNNFEIAVIIVTCLNVLIMACEFYLMPQFLQTAINIIGYIFLVLIIFEVVFKVTGLGFRRYIAQRWNQIDLAIAVLSLLGKIIEVNVDQTAINPMLIRTARVFRIVRMFKLLKSASSLRQLVLALKQAIPHVVHLSMLFTLIFFIYASLGVQLFGTFEDCPGDICRGLSRHANFHNVGMAMLTLFRIFTGDNWNSILKDVLSVINDSEKCSRGGVVHVFSCGVLKSIAPCFFVSFVLFTQFILINIVLAVLMSQLEDVHQERKVIEEAIVTQQKNPITDIQRRIFQQINATDSCKMPLLPSRKSLPCLNNANKEMEFSDFPDDLQSSPSYPMLGSGRTITRSRSSPALVEGSRYVREAEFIGDKVVLMVTIHSISFIDEEQAVSDICSSKIKRDR